MRSTRTALAATVVAALLLTGCGGEDPAADETPTPSTTTEHTRRGAEPGGE